MGKYLAIAEKAREARETSSKLEAARGNARRLVEAAAGGNPLARELALYALGVVEKLEAMERSLMEAA